MSRIVKFVDETLHAMLERPRLWGSHRCVEGQIMRLLEVREVALDQEGPFDGAGRVERDYVAFLRSQLQGSPDTTLFTRVHEDEAEYKRLLVEFCRQTRDRQDSDAEEGPRENYLDAAQDGPVLQGPRTEAEAA